MKISRGFCAILGAVGLSVPALSLDVPATLFPNSTCSEWTAWMPPRTDPAVIMQAVTEGYIPVEKNFILLMEANSRFSRDNLYLLCLDEESEREIARMGIRCVRVVGDRSFRAGLIWKLRMKVLSCLLEAGYDVLASDADALWLKDPVPDFEHPEVRGSSIVASRGDMPPGLHSLWGSTLCMGFIFFRAGAGVNMVLAATEHMRTSDDQRAINLALKNMGIEWDMTTDMRFVPSTGFGRGTVPVDSLEEGSLNVTLLPHNKYTRRCNEAPVGSNTTVAHCHAGKKGSLKVAWMKKKNMWVLDEGEKVQVEIEMGELSEGYDGESGTWSSDNLPRF